MKKVIIFILLVACVKLNAHAQIDPHLSQYYVYPSWLNPALTGAFDGDYRLSGVYRNQWGSISDGFTTSGFSADMNTAKNLNFGISGMQQTAGAGYKYTNVNASASYSGVRFDDEGYKRLVFGVQIGFINRRFDASKFQYGDDWNPSTGYTSGSGGSVELLENSSSSVLDLGTGVVYYDASPDKKANIFIGFSVAHINQPKSTFISSVDQKLPARYTVHGGVKLNISELISVVPNALYMRQGNADEKMVGAYAQINGPGSVDVLLGANYRFDDAFVPYLGLNIKNVVFGFSYDLNNSQLGKNIANANGTEISLSYVIRRSKTLGQKHFICPRF